MSYGFVLDGAGPDEPEDALPENKPPTCSGGASR